MLSNKKFILASNSVSRKVLLKNAGLSFFIEKPLCDEDYIKNQLLKKSINKKKLPKLLAKAKALSVSKKITKHLVVGSDTIILFNNKIINKATKKKSMEPSFIKSIYKVLFADITISFDNVIGVVGASKGNFGFMIFGLVLSVVLTGALASYLANYVQKHIWIAYVGLAFILIVAIQLIIGGLVDLNILNVNEEFIKYF